MKNHDQPHHWGISVYSSIRHMNPEALAQVLENADPNAVFNDGCTALTLCSKHPEDEPEMARVLIESGARLDLRDSKACRPWMPAWTLTTPKCFAFFWLREPRHPP